MWSCICLASFHDPSLLRRQLRSSTDVDARLTRSRGNQMFLPHGQRRGSVARGKARSLAARHGRGQGTVARGKAWSEMVAREQGTADRGKEWSEVRHGRREQGAVSCWTSKGCLYVQNVRPMSKIAVGRLPQNFGRSNNL